MYQNKLKCQTGHTGEASHSFIHGVILWELSTLQLKWHLPTKKRENNSSSVQELTTAFSFTCLTGRTFSQKLDKTLPNNNWKHLKMTVIWWFFPPLFKKSAVLGFSRKQGLTGNGGVVNFNCEWDQNNTNHQAPDVWIWSTAIEHNRLQPNKTLGLRKFNLNSIYYALLNVTEQITFKDHWWQHTVIQQGTYNPGIPTSSFRCEQASWISSEMSLKTKGSPVEFSSAKSSPRSVWPRKPIDNQTKTIILRQSSLIDWLHISSDTFYLRINKSMSSLNVQTTLHRSKIAAEHETNDWAGFNFCSHLKVVRQTFWVFKKNLFLKEAYTQTHKHTHISP